MKLPSRLHLAGACLILPLAFGASAAGAPAAVDAARIIAADREPGNWMSHGRTYDEQRHSPLKSINDRNVGELGLAWTARLDIDRGVEATPIVVDGVMYTTGAKSIVYAFDARSGTLLWKFDPEVPGIRLSEGCCDVVNRGVAVWQDVHQDHQVIHQEGLRAFKNTTFAGYELPWNNYSFHTNFFMRLAESDLTKKTEALKEYQSQAHRNYMQEDFIRSLAKVRGVQCNSEYAEAFELYKLIS